MGRNPVRLLIPVILRCHRLLVEAADKRNPRLTAAAIDTFGDRPQARACRYVHQPDSLEDHCAS